MWSSSKAVYVEITVGKEATIYYGPPQLDGPCCSIRYLMMAPSQSEQFWSLFERRKILYNFLWDFSDTLVELPANMFQAARCSASCCSPSCCSSWWETSPCWWWETCPASRGTLDTAPMSVSATGLHFCLFVCLSVCLSGCNICLLVWYGIFQHLLWWVWPSGGSRWPNTSLCLWSGIQMFKFEWKHCSTSLKMTRQTSARGTTPGKELAGLGRLIQHRGGHHHLGQGGQVPADHRVCRQQYSMYPQLDHKRPSPPWHKLFDILGDLQTICK